MNDTVSPFSTGAPAPMTHAPTSTTPRLRLWPGIVLVVLMWLVIRGTGWVASNPMAQFMAMVFGPYIAAVAIAIWWLFFSRANWTDRLLALGLCIGAGIAVFFLCHPSYHMGLVLYGLPVVLTAWVAWLVVAVFLGRGLRLAGLLLVIALSWGYQTLIRFDGVDGAFNPDLAWRWSPTAEDRFLAEKTAEEPVSPVPAVGEAPVLVLGPGDWPGFRGPDRDGRLRGVRVATDWKTTPPKMLWKQRIGPGWSSFAVVGNHAVTQEQRGDDEVVVCYAAETGNEIWIHKDPTRFHEDVAGPGPRATPTFHQGRIYACGANGTLNCLEAATGKPVWSRNILAESGREKPPMWGFAASPLVVDGIVTVFAGGSGGKAILAYHAETGSPAWSAGEGTHSYTSTHRARLNGVEQLLALSDEGLTSLDPKEGTILWHHPWKGPEGLARVLQPIVLNDTDVVIATWMGVGTRRLHIGHEDSQWTAHEVWTTKRFNPYYSDLVVHNGHVFGIDNGFLNCIHLEDGANRWKARGYGNGQLLLLADQGLLLIITEKGDVALVEANPEKHQEVTRFKALNGKTWNHPVVAHGKLFVRNGEEAACYQLPLADR